MTTAHEALAAFGGGPGSHASPNGSGPMIKAVGRPMRDVTSDALAALQAANTPPTVFVRGGALTRVRCDEDERPIVEHLDEASLRGILARVAYFAQGKGEHIAPPKDIVSDLKALGAWPLPALVGITETPALRPDGTVLAEPGYDPATRLKYMPAPGLTVPAIPVQPTAKDCQGALALLHEALEGFPFEDEASRANALALMITPVVRPAIPGQVPLALLDATKAGTGKGLLVSLAAQIATGRPAAMLAAPAREEEWQKTLLAVLARGSTFVVIDEAAELQSPTLAAVLTAPTFEGRLLGRSEIVQLPQRITWAAAGNNVRVGGDLARRCYWIRLDAKTARPWQRRGFRHPDLLTWAAEQRGRLVAALLTLARGWFAAGRPAIDLPPLGGFDQWARMIGGILAYAGVEGFLRNLDEFYEQADHEASEWEAFLIALLDVYEHRTFTTGDLGSRLSDEECTLRDSLPGELAEALGKKPASFKTKLGKSLGKRDGTRYGDEGIRVERASQDSRSKISNWRVLRDQVAETQRSQSSVGLRGEESDPIERWGNDDSATSTPLQSADEAADPSTRRGSS